MATTVYAGYDCWYASVSQLGWLAVRGASSANAVNCSSNSHDFSLYTTYTAGRGAASFYNRRVAFRFDLSGQTGTVTAASFFWYCDLMQSTQGTDARVVHNTGFSTSGNAADYNNLDFTEPHSDAVTLSTTLGYQEFALNSDALTRINSAVGSGDYDLMAVEEDHDYANTTPTINQYFRVKGYFSEWSSIPILQPKLVLTFGYDKSVAGSDDPVKVIGVATSEIEKVIGV